MGNSLEGCPPPAEDTETPREPDDPDRDPPPTRRRRRRGAAHRNPHPHPIAGRHSDLITPTRTRTRWPPPTTMTSIARRDTPTGTPAGTSAATVTPDRGSVGCHAHRQPRRDRRLHSTPTATGTPAGTTSATIPPETEASRPKPRRPDRHARRHRQRRRSRRRSPMKRRPSKRSRRRRKPNRRRPPKSFPPGPRPAPRSAPPARRWTPKRRPKRRRKRYREAWQRLSPHDAAARPEQPVSSAARKTLQSPPPGDQRLGGAAQRRLLDLAGTGARNVGRRRPRRRGAAPCSWRARAAELAQRRRRRLVAPARSTTKAAMFSPRTGSATPTTWAALHGRVAGERLLDLGGGDVDAGGLDDVLDAAAEVQVAGLVEASRGRRCGRSPRRRRSPARGTLVVALHQGRALHQDLAGLARAARAGASRDRRCAISMPGERPAEGAGADRLGVVEARGGDAGGGLRHAVDADGLVVGAEQARAPARDRCPSSAAACGGAKSGCSSSGPA